MRVATLGTIINHESALHSDISFFSDYTLNESLYELKTHRAIVRATFKLKERKEPISLITMHKFLKEHDIPKTIQEENELLEVFAYLPVTLNTFNFYIDELNKAQLKRFRV
jgi:replicative DNA helicase